LFKKSNVGFVKTVPASLGLSLVITNRDDYC